MLAKYLCAVSVLCLGLVMPAAADVVYKNTTTPITGTMYPEAAQGFYPFNYFNPGETTGDMISLAGTARNITSFQMLLYSSEPVTLPTLKLAFWLNDGQDSNGADGAPGTTLWFTTKTDVAVDGLTAVTFDVPHVHVPDTFTWTATADSMLAGLALYDSQAPDLIGTNHMGYWDGDAPTGIWFRSWFAFDPVMNFGAQIEASTTPEPASMAVLATGCLPLLRRRRVKA